MKQIITLEVTADEAGLIMASLMFAQQKVVDTGDFYKFLLNSELFAKIYHAIETQ